MVKLSIVTSFFVICLACVSCKNKTLVDISKTIESSEWNENNPLKFSFDITDTITPYNIFYQTVNNSDYPFSNLYLFTDIRFPNGKIIRDTTEILLSNSQGKWIGKGWFGSYTSTVPYRINIRFPEQGNYTFTITQAMRCPNKNLSGIESLKLLIQKK